VRRGSEPRLGFGAAVGGVGGIRRGGGWWEGVFAKVERGSFAKRHQHRISASLRRNKFYTKGFCANYMNMVAVASGHAEPFRDL
jgi:hypothetical protein